ncbi:LysR substrate-binding domain-containing protein [Pseudomonas aeruginosa]
MISLRQLHYFVEIVESGGFSRAAERLFVAQSAPQPAGARTGGQHRHPTAPPRSAPGRADAGRSRLPATRAAPARRPGGRPAPGSRGRRRRPWPAAPGALQLGAAGGRPEAALRGYLAAQSGVRLELTQQSSEQQLADLAEGRLDLGLLRPPVLRQHPRLHLRALYREPLLLALAADHPLARREAPVALAALAGETFVSIPHLQRGGLSYRAAELCLGAGFYPRPARALSRKTSQLQLIEAGFGVAPGARLDARHRTARRALHVSGRGRGIQRGGAGLATRR